MEINRSLSRYEIALLASGYKRIGGEKIFVTVFTKADSLRIKNNPLLGKLAGWKKERRRKKKKKKIAISELSARNSISSRCNNYRISGSRYAGYRMCNLR